MQKQIASRKKADELYEAGRKATEEFFQSSYGISFSALMNKSISSSVPMDTRR